MMIFSLKDRPLIAIQFKSFPQRIFYLRKFTRNIQSMYFAYLTTINDFQSLADVHLNICNFSCGNSFRFPK